MLNLSNNNPILEDIDRFSTVRNLANRPHYKTLNRIILGAFLIFLLILFMPWTQNIGGTGAVTTLKPGQRPQTIHTAIAGRVEKWYVKEGDFVKKGDTIVYISEIKDDYFDPNLVGNTKNQVNAKKMALDAYGEKVTSLEQQFNAIEKERKLKMAQAQNKIKQSYLKIASDSMDLEAVTTQLKIANTQFTRAITLNKEGLKPLSDVEEKKLKLQEMQAKLITQENKLLTSRNELLNAKVEINRIEAEYAEKGAKSNSDKFTAMSNQFDTEAQVNKLENQFVNYSIRNGLYYITAPQDGYVNRTLQAGIGETVKEGTQLVSIMPALYDIAVETYVSPTDMPLIHKGEKVRIWFDGWPTIIFSGWPNMSYGTFGGKIVAVERFISPNGKFRVLIAPDPADHAWPKQINIGSGAQTLALLNNVPVWFELWRTLSGFPPNYYAPTTSKMDNSKPAKTE
jgi:multidrug resistance efflux pump